MRLSNENRTLASSMNASAANRAGSILSRFAVAALAAVPVLWVVPGRADQSAAGGGPPVVTIRSTSGALTISGGETSVRIRSGAPNATFGRFVVNSNNRRVQLPRTGAMRRTFAGLRSLRLPARRFELPAALEGRQGVAIGNPGGDMNVGVPQRVGALFVNAGGSDVELSNIRGPYVIQSTGGAVRLHNVFGRGLIRTLNGDIDLTGVGGNVRVETAAGNVSAHPSMAERVEITTGTGAIDWTFGRLGSGVYRFASASGLIRIEVRPGAGAFIDAQSDTGTVTNGLDPLFGQVRFSTPHAVSLQIGAGGPEITAYSKNGSVILVPVGGR